MDTNASIDSRKDMELQSANSLEISFKILTDRRTVQNAGTGFEPLRAVTMI
jgi:hypothetical protein